MDGDSECDLITRCRKGEAAAWDDLFNLHYAATARFIFHLSGSFSHEDAEELCQETFLSVVRNLGSFHGRSRLQTWIFRIARNKARDCLARENAGKRGGGCAPLSLQDEAAGDPPSEAPGPDQALLSGERARQVETALAELAEPCREVIELRYFADLSYEEIAAELKLNPKTVSSRLSKCLDRFEKIARRIFCGKNTGAFPV